MKRATRWIPVLLLTLGSATALAQQDAAALSFGWDEVVQPKADSPLRWPVGVAAGSSGEILVADAYESRLLILKEGTEGWTQAREVALDGAPYAIAYDGNRFLLSLREDAGLIAVEGARHQLRKVALTGGVAPGALAPVPGGGFLVYDQSGGQVLKLDASGSPSDSWPVDGPVTALAAASNGGFFAAIAHRATVVFHGADGREQQRFTVPGSTPVPAWPSGIVTDPDGNLVVVDRHGGRLLKLDVSGRLEGRGSRMGWDPGLLRFPTGLCWLPDGRLAVADQGNGRVQLFRPLVAEAAP